MATAGKRVRSAAGATDNLRAILKSQYHAALAMLRAAITRCPEHLWTAGDGHANPYWRLAYHTLYYTHLYLQPDLQAFHPWTHHRRGIQRTARNPGSGPRRPSPRRPPGAEPPYTKADVLAYWRICDGLVDNAVDTLDLGNPHSGFSWYPLSKLEHQIINLRHIQHHAAQLTDRLRAATGAGINWESSRKTPRRRGNRRVAAE
ncbi:MAG TPA: DinB family protein [bacterium]|nr:DinB family protein [bacterium]